MPHATVTYYVALAFARSDEGDIVACEPQEARSAVQAKGLDVRDNDLAESALSLEVFFRKPRQDCRASLLVGHFGYSPTKKSLDIVYQ
jgi:hypothetical protein